ncbi:KpsF/GutQ family sugar-phosphate isomerase [Psychroflexus planctonicus]|uniref:D-arabinose 5-phosphate isomerase n=1 Tax=Psychroflexus planctonicus TaxID=1526575 RepID=A0ABQ1SHI3_9FLAO|nr:KpsF/GutQ family sugar-phosphate isomerase [Psychroflexus planctonicus]GGE36192.1 D-arabinose 5-phosphate isomerase [Psychroflexus planctonicus]
MNSDEILHLAKDTIFTQSNSIKGLASLLTTDFSEVVQQIYFSKGRVIITGIGKSAIIANKIVATLNSTGTPAIFMHAADAIHGDLGSILKDDVVICISKSGNTPEIKVLVPLIKNFKNKLIAITGNVDSYLAKQADFVLNSYVDKEACPINLAPTTSTTAQLVMGDALAVCLLKMRGFSSQDFAKYHPGGSLGKTLYLKVSDITLNNMKPQVTPDADVKEVIVVISQNMLGATAVLENDKIIGIITDGDIRRMLTDNQDFMHLKAKDIMSSSPKTISNSALAVKALELLENNSISQVLVEEDNKYAGVVHLHNLIKEGII